MARERDNDYTGHILSNFCGLGGSGIPRHAVDAACKRHDQGYTALLAAGHSKAEVYGRFNKYDKEFMDFLTSHVPANKEELVLAQGAKAIFGFKRAITPSKSLSNMSKRQKVEQFFEYLQRINPQYKLTSERIDSYYQDYIHGREPGQVPPAIEEETKTDTEQTPDRRQHPKEVTIDSAGNRANQREGVRQLNLNHRRELQNINRGMEPTNATPAIHLEATAASDGGEGGDYQTSIQKGLKPFKPWHDVVEAICSNNFWFSVQGQERYNDLYTKGNEPVPNAGAVQGTTTLTVKMTDPYRPFNWMDNNRYITAVRTPSNGYITRGIDYQNKAGRYLQRQTPGPLINAGGLVLNEDVLSPLPQQNISVINIPSDTNLKWFDYYRTLYQNYTIVAVHWKLHIDVPHPVIKTIAQDGTNYEVGMITTQSLPATAPPQITNLGKLHGKLFWWYEQTSSDATVARTNIPSNETTNLQTWPGLKGQLDMHPGGHYTIEDTWHWGKYQHNAINDKDINTWALCGPVGSPPGYQGTNNYTETVRFAFKRGDWSTEKEGTYQIPTLGCPANCRLDVQYKIQFRDLTQQAMWIPQAGLGYLNTVGQPNAANVGIFIPQSEQALY